MISSNTNVQNFITHWSKFPALSTENAYHENAWHMKDVGQLGGGRNFIYFSTAEFKAKPSKHDKRKPTPAAIPEELLLPEPFRSFSKSFLIYLHTTKPSVAIPSRISALQYLHSSLLKLTHSSDPCFITQEVLLDACSVIEKKFSSETSNNYFYQLGTIYSHMITHDLFDVPFDFKRPTLSRHELKGRFLGEFKEIRQKRLPDPLAIEALGEMFNNQLDHKTCQLVTSICALLICAPERIVEVLHAPLNVLDSDLPVDDQGNPGVGLRWTPAKGGEPTVKFLSDAMIPIAERAIEKLKKHSAPARTIARWYESHPEKLYLPSHLEHLRTKPILNQQEVHAVLFGGKIDELGDIDKARVRSHLKKLNIPRSYHNGRVTVKFTDIETNILKRLPDNFPVFDRRNGQKYSKSLLLQRPNEIRSAFPLNCLCEPVEYSTIKTYLISQTNGKNKSLFERFNYRDKNNKHLTIKPHMFRHYLDTLAEHTMELSASEIAAWSGRSSVIQNNVYNHVSDSDVILSMKEALGTDPASIGPFPDISTRKFITRDEFPSAPRTTSHTTPWGYCNHDFVQSPCPAARGCAMCFEHSCIKGDLRAQDNLYKRRQELRLLVEDAHQAFDQNILNAAEWFQYHLEDLRTVEALISTLEDPTVPEGAEIRLSEFDPPSRIAAAVSSRIALEKHDLIQIASAEKNLTGEQNEGHNPTKKKIKKHR